jgi:hypothetical protein
MMEFGSDEAKDVLELSKREAAEAAFFAKLSDLSEEWRDDPLLADIEGVELAEHFCEWFIDDMDWDSRAAWVEWWADYDEDMLPARIWKWRISHEMLEEAVAAESAAASKMLKKEAASAAESAAARLHALAGLLQRFADMWPTEPSSPSSSSSSGG